jgi:formylglycine-generating enzyme
VRARSAFAAVVVLSLGLACMLMWARLTGSEPGPDAPRRALPPPSATASEPPSPPDAEASAAALVPELPDGGEPLGDGGVGLPSPVPPYVQALPDSERRCPGGMLAVEGVSCPYVAYRCRAPAGASADAGCQRYAPELLCEGRPSALRFCMDRFEYPNLAGVRPAIMVSYDDAQRACRIEGKRLCTADEWAMACEGPQRWPLTYGLERVEGACNVDRPVRTPDPRAFALPEQVSLEVERLDQRVPSGSMPACVSAFGIYDLPGNVAEWVDLGASRRPGGRHEHGVAGGGSGPSHPCRFLADADRAGARPFETGFRCCANTLDGTPARRTMPKGFRLARKQRIEPPTGSSGHQP